VLDLLRAKGVDDIIVFGGGIIPPADADRLKELGVAAVFTPGATMASITQWLEGVLDGREAVEARSGED
jgi:methylmalonyl-CoA mutase C-terminal domain/subunit